MGHAGTDIAPDPTNSNRVPTRENRAKTLRFLTRQYVVADAQQSAISAVAQ
jgi:hypothetical protein